MLITRPVVYADCKSIINRICAERDYAGTPNVIIMADGGGKFFKVCATILPEHYDWTLDKQLVADAAQSLVSPMKKKRSTYAEGGSLKKGKLTGVKRVILLAVVPDIKETHSNISVIFELIGLNNIAFKIVSDFKLQLLVLGLQTATATHPCGYCLISQSELKKRKIEAVGERTFGSLKSDHEGFLESGGMHGDAKYHHNCLNPCILHEDLSMKILNKYIVPELHLILGFVDHVWKAVARLVGKERACLWPSRENLVPKGYQGGTLEGNACRKLLKLGDKLLDPEILGNVPAAKMKTLVHAVKCMDKLVTACFSTNVVEDNIDILVDNLGKAILATNMTITLKMHVLLCHLIPTLKLSYFNGRGLGVCTEQAGESIHSYFRDHFWKDLERSDVNHPEYTPNLRRAVVECASKAI